MFGAATFAAASGVTVVFCVFCAVACGGGHGDRRPVASLASTESSTIAFAEIQRAWDEATTRAAFEALERALKEFLVRFPTDGRAALARAYLCFAQMELGNWSGADATLQTLRSAQPGTTRDIVTIAEARILRHDGKPSDALDTVRPLVGKIVDTTIRELFLEEITHDALDAHRDFEAIAYMDAWLRGVGEDKRDQVRAKVVERLASIRTEVLEQTYRAIRANQTVLGYGADIQRLLAERLAAAAVARGDATLARWLLDSDAGPMHVTGDAVVALGEIATSKRGLTSVAGRTVGLLLATASPDLRDEAADVARGVAWALELPRRDPAGGDGLRLVTRDDGGDAARVEIALEELAGEGASVFVAALDPSTADRAIAWAEAHAAPLILLSVPDRATPGTWTFVLGASRDGELGVVADDLAARGVTKAALVAAAPADVLEGRSAPFFSPRVACDVAAPRAGEPRFPVAEWEAQAVRTVVVAGPTECARDVVRELGERRRPVSVVLTLDAASTATRASARATTRAVPMRAVSAGVIPVATANAADDPDLQSYMAQFGAPPSWYAALGRDAGALARAALRPLPLDTASDKDAIAQRRALARAGIAATTARLWTTDARGFAGAHAIARALHVVELAPPK